MKQQAKRKWISILLTLCMLLTLLPVQVFAADIIASKYIGEGLQWTLDSNGVLTFEKNPNSSSADYTMPGYLTFTWTDKETNYWQQIKSVVIKSPVANIGEAAFQYCYYLKSIDIAESVTEIGRGVFDSCTALSTITVDPANTHFAAENNVLFELDANGNKTILRKMALSVPAGFIYTLPDSVTTISEEAFKGSSRLGGIDMSHASQLKTIGGYAFHGCFASGSVDIIIPDTVTSIGSQAFNNCKGLRSVNVPGGIKTTGSIVSGCASFAELTVDSGVQTLSGNTVTNCNDFQILHLPKTVVTIGNNAVPNGDSLTIYYEGTAAEWRAINLGQKNLADATIYLNGGTGDADKAYHVRYDANGGTGSMDTQIRDAEDANQFVLPENGFTAPDGMVFNGWDVGGTTYQPGETCPLTGSTTVKPVWISDADATYTIGFSANGGSGEMESVTIKRTEAGAYTLPECSFTAPAGKVFAGWQVGTDTAAKQPGTTCAISADTTISATWKIDETASYTVTFDAGGGSGSMEAVTLNGTQAAAYQLPACGFTPPEGQLFKGWQINSTILEAGATYPITSDITVTALWKEKPVTRSYTLSFDAGGGSGSMESVTVTGTPTASYTLPANGFTAPAGKAFSGWQVGEDTALKQPGAACTIDADTTITAVWKAPDVHVTVSFNTNGGSAANPTTKDVVKGQPYGSLPTTTKADFIFEGWYTAAVGGERVTADDTVEVDGPQTLYAHWVRDYLSELTYRFSNSASAFGYKKGYRIPYNRFRMVYGDNALAKMKYEWEGEWGGSCGGMATSASLFYMPNTVKTIEFREGPSVPNGPNAISGLTPNFWSNEWDLSVRAFIEAMQLYQCSAVVPRYELETKNRLEHLWDAVEGFQKDGGQPIYISVWRFGGGHALVGYRVETISDTEGRIYVYDCNSPRSHDRYITVTRDAPGADYSHWSYAHYDVSINFSQVKQTAPPWLTPRAGSVPTRAAGDTIDRTQGEWATVDPQMSLLMLNSDDAEICDAQGETVVTISAGIIHTNRDDIYPVLPLGDVAVDASNPDDFMPPDSDVNSIWLPAGLYTVTNQDESIASLRAAMVNVDYAASVTTSGDIASLYVKDEENVSYVRLAEPDVSYEIQLDDATDPSQYTEIRLTGANGAEAVSFAQLNDTLYVNGANAQDTGIEFTKRINGNVYNDIDLDKETYEQHEQKEFAEVPWDALSEEDMPAAMPATIGNAIKGIEVSFDANGGSGGMAAIQASTGTPLVFPACGFTPPAGKQFDKWAVGSAGGYETVAAGDAHILTGDVTLYALWKNAGTSSGSSGSGSGSLSGSVTTTDSSHGKVSLSANNAPKGSTVTIQLTPDKGYQVGTITVRDKTGAILEVTRVSDTQYTFVMPEGKVTVTAEFVESTTAPIVFTDVKSSDYFADAVQWAVEQGITNGTGATQFSPNASCTRGQMVTFLWRAAGSPAAAGESPFTDILPSDYFYDAVCWAANEGIAQGTSATTFGPDATVTRGQAVTFLYRYAGAPDMSNNNVFDDVAANTYYTNAVSWAASQGIANGISSTAFGPANDCTRAHTVTFLYRYSN